MFENLFKKDPAAKIEGLEGQIKAEKMKLMSNEEKLKTYLEDVGGIEGLNKKINSKDNIFGVVGGVGLGTAMSGVGIGALAMLYSHSTAGMIDPIMATDQVGQFMETVRIPALTTLTASGALLTGTGAYAAFKSVKDWWGKKKLENLKEAVTAQGLVG